MENTESEDIYNDLDNFDLGGRVEQLVSQNEALHQHIRSLEKDVEKLCAKITDMKKNQDALAKNISELYKTARAELDRKDRLIADLRRQLDDYILRRIKVQRPPPSTNNNNNNNNPVNVPVVKPGVKQSEPKKSNINVWLDPKASPPIKQLQEEKSRLKLALQGERWPGKKDPKRKPSEDIEAPHPEKKIKHLERKTEEDFNSRYKVLKSESRSRSRSRDHARHGSRNKRNDHRYDRDRHYQSDRSDRDRNWKYSGRDKYQSGFSSKSDNRGNVKSSLKKEETKSKSDTSDRKSEPKATEEPVVVNCQNVGPQVQEKEPGEIDDDLEVIDVDKSPDQEPPEIVKPPPQNCVSPPVITVSDSKSSNEKSRINKPKSKIEEVTKKLLFDKMEESLKIFEGPPMPELKPLNRALPNKRDEFRQLNDVNMAIHQRQLPFTENSSSKKFLETEQVNDVHVLKNNKATNNSKATNNLIQEIVAKKKATISHRPRDKKTKKSNKPSVVEVTNDCNEPKQEGRVLRSATRKKTPDNVTANISLSPSEQKDQSPKKSPMKFPDFSNPISSVNLSHNGEIPTLHISSNDYNNLNSSNRSLFDFYDNYLNNSPIKSNQVPNTGGDLIASTPAAELNVLNKTSDLLKDDLNISSLDESDEKLTFKNKFSVNNNDNSNNKSVSVSPPKDVCDTSGNTNNLNSVVDYSTNSFTNNTSVSPDGSNTSSARRRKRCVITFID